MKYIIIDNCNEDVFTAEFETEKIAVANAVTQWARLSEYDKNRRDAFYVIESENPDPDSENHLDGRVIAEFK